MKIVLQNFKSGELSVQDAPSPSVSTGSVLVRTHASLISAGTDRAIIGLGRKTSLGKALDRPDLARKVINRARTEGLWPTYKVVTNLIAEPIPLGYSLVGTVLEIGQDVNDIAVGDRVACAGLGHANHAEIVSIPRNLAVGVPNGVKDEQAAYVTLGAIAMHGLRQADQQIGCSVLVIGLGLVGLLTVQLCVAAGYRTFGIDLDPSKLALAKAAGAIDAFLGNDASVQTTLRSLTGGYGVDAVILTAASRTSGKVFESIPPLCRDRAKLIIVGDVKMDIPRRPYFEKEIEIFQSRSYGPGRYDPAYEIKGQDYPIGYVRWTERRNFDSFLKLINDGRINPATLTTHRYPIDRAADAYELVTGQSGGAVGILLEYPHQEELAAPAVAKHAVKGTRIKLGVIGTGQFSKGILLPEILKTGAFDLKGVASARGLSAKAVAEKYKADFSTTNVEQVLDDPDIDAVVIATRHDTHARYVVKSLERGKHVFVEKPLAITPAEVDAVKAATRNSRGTLTVGFNRRFSPMVQSILAHFSGRSEPLSMLYRINSGRIPLGLETSWVHDPSVGGGRIIGESCHFVDTLSAIAGSDAIDVSVSGIPSRRADLAGQDTATFTITFEDGSIGTIHYWANGDPVYPKEHLEVFGSERIAVMRNFRSLDLVAGGKQKRQRSFSADKGFAGEAAAFAAACKTGNPAIPLESLLATSQVTIAVDSALRSSGDAESVSENE